MLRKKGRDGVGEEEKRGQMGKGAKGKGMAGKREKISHQNVRS
jgi:hypothetical protein